MLPSSCMSRLDTLDSVNTDVCMDLSIVGAYIGKCTLCTSDMCVREFKVQRFMSVCSTV